MSLTKIQTLEKIKLEPVHGSSHCEYSVIENKLKVIYENQEKLLQAIKLLGKHSLDEVRTSNSNTPEK
jgi:hypothetical protein